jgi:predicted ribosome quality control (RQC) complex YloA/Tae2 family protein
VLRRSDAAATAGLFHESVERMGRLGERIGGLRTILEREIRRIDNAEREVERDRDRFGDPETHRVWGEAILAGLDGARRVGEAILVLDPYGTGDTQIAVPADPALSPTEVAETHFRRSRRARRGIERAESRLRALSVRRSRLGTLLAGIGDVAGETGVEELERRMLDERIPVGLEPDRRGRASARLSRPRIEGVRVYAASDGSTILAGKGGRDNQRLTFKLASPTDFWLHVEGAPGAHVILRNEERSAQPSERALAEAAGVAAWYSDLRGEEWVTVRWTQRKNVRKPRSAALGTVVIKRFRTVRVRPALPGGSGEPTR